MKNFLFLLLILVLPSLGFSRSGSVPLCQSNHKNCFYISPETLMVTYDHAAVSAPQSNNPSIR
ncbi:hypothetical protein D6219_03845 [Coxiella burnetii]|nr:hypothetical protein AUR58_03880 [Coxiella burnetii]ATN68379.1 hypothetical protein AYM00_03585 [Coxiella burnetii]ATN72247.1 hypothetical protein AYM11_03350 [Coxiella burnetii]AZV75031.1 hypothetical protein D6219_03845 [Coxiella burnetii]PNT84309.1 hypothetical protein C2L93_07050 [Coxiella burnetii]